MTTQSCVFTQDHASTKVKVMAAENPYSTSYGNRQPHFGIEASSDQASECRQGTAPQIPADQIAGTSMCGSELYPTVGQFGHHFHVLDKIL